MHCLLLVVHVVDPLYHQADPPDISRVLPRKARRLLTICGFIVHRLLPSQYWLNSAQYVSTSQKQLIRRRPAAQLSSTVQKGCKTSIKRSDSYDRYYISNRENIPWVSSIQSNSTVASYHADTSPPQSLHAQLKRPFNHHFLPCTTPTGYTVCHGKYAFSNSNSNPPLPRLPPSPPRLSGTVINGPHPSSPLFPVSNSAHVSTSNGFSNGRFALVPSSPIGLGHSNLRCVAPRGASFVRRAKSKRRKGTEALIMPLLVSTWPQRRRSAP